MAVIKIAQPELITSAFNPNVRIVDSANKTKDGFRYLFKITENHTNKVVAQLSVAPRPSDNYGELDLSEILQQLVECDINMNLLDTAFFQSTTAPVFTYRCDLGEEFFTQWGYTDTIFNSGRTECTGTTVPPFVVGDSVEIIPNNPTIFPAFTGLMNVHSISGNNVTFDFTHVSTPPNAGVLKFADNRKIRTWNAVSYDLFKVINSAIEFNEWNKFSMLQNYSLFPTIGRFASELDTSFEVYSFQELYLLTSFFQSVNPININWLRDDSTLITQSIASLNWTSEKGVYINAFPKSLISGNYVAVSTTKYFDVWLDNGTDELTQRIRVFINQNCAPNKCQLLFTDSIGSVLSFPFIGFIQKNRNATVTNYNRMVDFDDNGEYKQASTRGVTSYASTFETDYVLNSGVLRRQDEPLIHSLISSRNVWLKLGSTLMPVTVKTSSYQLKDVLQKGLRRVQIVVEPSNKTMVNG